MLDMPEPMRRKLEQAAEVAQLGRAPQPESEPQRNTTTLVGVGADFVQTARARRHGALRADGVGGCGDQAGEVGESPTR